MSTESSTSSGTTPPYRSKTGSDKGATSRNIAVVGGGLAGLAAGCALADAGYRVTLTERRPYLGGRASSYEHPGTGEVVDNCQHVLLGCCTNLLDFYGRIGVADKIRWYKRLVFVEPGGRQSVLEPGNLPAPMHASWSFLRASFLSLSDKLAIARGMLALAGGLPEDSGPPFSVWLREHGQTARAIERFWKPVLVSALNEDLERISSRYAALVFRDSFLKSAKAGEMGLPAVPLTELYAAAGEYIRARGGEVRVRAGVQSLAEDDDGVRLCIGGNEERFDAAVMAVPFQVLAAMLPNDSGAELRGMLEKFETSPITGVHFWFDRQISELEHAVLLERTIQWMFHKSRIQGRTGEGSYVELVVSSSKELVDKPRQEIQELALKELGEFFPAVREAKLLKATVIKEIHATYAPLPGTDVHRPGPTTPWPNIFVAGDYTQTGWPATMEGAVRSGYQAAEAMAGKKFLVADLAASGFMGIA
jgi:squalene-associated FAD-dependent desaturase